MELQALTLDKSFRAALDSMFYFANSYTEEHKKWLLQLLVAQLFNLYGTTSGYGVTTVRCFSNGLEVLSRKVGTFRPVFGRVSMPPAVGFNLFLYADSPRRKKSSDSIQKNHGNCRPVRNGVCSSNTQTTTCDFLNHPTLRAPSDRLASTRLPLLRLFWVTA